jgi:hypothetical protein
MYFLLHDNATDIKYTCKSSRNTGSMLYLIVACTQQASDPLFSFVLFIYSFQKHFHTGQRII